MYSIPTELYWVEESTNATLQGMNSAVVADINKLIHRGIDTDVGASWRCH